LRFTEKSYQNNIMCDKLIISFGQYKGKKVSEVPKNHLQKFFDDNWTSYEGIGICELNTSEIRLMHYLSDILPKIKLPYY